MLPFRTERSGADGRIVRLGAVADAIIGGHGYPEPVSRLLGEALALAAMLGSALNDGGRLSLEVRSEGPVRSLAVNLEAPGRLRGYVGFDAAAVAATGVGSASLLGAGHLALTIEPGPGADSYQGVAALDGGSLGDAARAYFRQSEQIPTFVRLAVARELVGEPGRTTEWRWRAGGLLVQHLGVKGLDDRGVAEVGHGGNGDAADLDTEASGEATAEEAWRRARMLAETVEDHELVDPTLAPERLLYRLFHEEGVRVRQPVPLGTYCRCSRERIERFLVQFGDADLDSLRDADGSITVTCEFCGKSYPFEAPVRK